jgi:hypothetical protein
VIPPTAPRVTHANVVVLEVDDSSSRITLNGQDGKVRLETGAAGIEGIQLHTLKQAGSATSVNLNDRPLHRGLPLQHSSH